MYVHIAGNFGLAASCSFIRHADIGTVLRAILIVTPISGLVVAVILGHRPSLARVSIGHHLWRSLVGANDTGSGIRDNDLCGGIGGLGRWSISGLSSWSGSWLSSWSGSWLLGWSSDIKREGKLVVRARYAYASLE